MLRLSTALRNALLGYQVDYTATTISADAASKQFRDSANQLLIKGFRPGDVIHSDITGNVGYFTIVSVAAGAITVSETVVDQAAGSSFTLQLAGHGASLRDVMKYGIIDIYSGSQPSSADAIETGTKLCSITVDAGAFTAGESTNGLNFDEPSSGVISKASGETWKGIGLANGTAGWFRFYDNAYQTGADGTNYKRRFDGSVGLSGADLNLSSVSIATGGSVTISTFQLTLPANV